MSKSMRGPQAVARLARSIAAVLAMAGMSAWSAQKFDAQIGSLIAEPSAAGRYEAAAVSLAKREPGVFVDTLVRFEGDGLERMAGMGARIRSVLGNIATVDVPLERLAELADLPEVLYVEGGRARPLRLNFSVPATKANLLRSGTAPNYNAGGLTGKGVIVGIIDDGIDFRSLDFRNADGTTRLISLWDQRTSGGSNASPPSG